LGAAKVARIKLWQKGSECLKGCAAAACIALKTYAAVTNGDDLFVEL